VEAQQIRIWSLRTSVLVVKTLVKSNPLRW